MSAVSSLIETLAFDTPSNVGRRIRKAYFTLGYSTSLLNNLNLAWGAITGYLIMAGYFDQINLVGVIAVIGETILATYLYNVVYVVNDIIDWHEDIASNRTKKTARHILGDKWFRTIFPMVNLLLITAVISIWPQVTIPLVGYALALALLSIWHTTIKRTKGLTIFIERMAKYCAPLWFVAILNPTPTTLGAVFGAQLLYPVSFLADFSYWGYLIDKLHRPTRSRFVVYTIYWFIVGTILLTIRPIDDWLYSTAVYLLFGTGGIAISNLVVSRKKAVQIDHLYSKTDSREKELLISFGLVQLGLLALAAIIALI